jgi:hypothetical protein
MGGANRPNIACKYGWAFIRMLRERVKEFQGNPQLNCWWTGFQSRDMMPPGPIHARRLIPYGLFCCRSSVLHSAERWQWPYFSEDQNLAQFYL